MHRFVEFLEGSLRGLQARRSTLTALLLWACCACAAVPLAAQQCPDGTPPPCSRQPPGRTAGPAPNSVAVLYFDNLSRDTADAYLVDGLTQQIIERLGRVSRLAVTSRFAVARFRGRSGAEPAAVGNALRVRYLVTGSIQRSGSRLRIAAELLHASTGVRSWGDTYDTDATDLLVVQDRIAQAVASGVAGRLLPAERAALILRATRAPAANDHLLRGDYLLARRNPDALRGAIVDFEAAIRLDPAFADAHARLGRAWFLFLNWSWPYPGLSPDTILGRALASVNRALELDPASGDAWGVQGQLAFDRGRVADGMAALARATVLTPGEPEAWHSLGVSSYYLGDDSAAAEFLRRAVAIDPGRAISLTWLGLGAYHAGRNGEARRWLDSALAVAPEFFYALVVRALVGAEVGDTTGALRDARSALLVAGGDSVLPAVTSAYVRVRFGLPGAVDYAHALAARRPANPEQRSILAGALLAAGDREAALTMLQPALRFYATLPMLRALRDDPEYRRIVDSAGPQRER